MARIGVALFGVGRAGMYHLPTLIENPDVDVLWLVDIPEARQRILDVIDKYDLKNTRLVTFDQSQEVLDDKRTKTVVITTPTAFHEDILKRSVRSGKQVFCEKPISFSAPVVTSCYAEAKKYGRLLVTGFNKRFDLDHVGFRQKRIAGDFGSLRAVYYLWRDPKIPAAYTKISGGVFCDSVIHQLDYVPWFVGERPSTVVATGNVTSEAADVYRSVNDVDSTVVTLQFPSGVYAVIEQTREQPGTKFYWRFEVVGTKGTFTAQMLTDTTLSVTTTDGSGKVVEERRPMTFWEGYKHEMNYFIKVVQGKEKNPVPEVEGIQASLLADLCQQSLTEGRVIQVPPHTV